jgi:uncharacterized protein (DUF58 family)
MVWKLKIRSIRYSIASPFPVKTIVVVVEEKLMIPSWRVYFLLGLGIAIAPLLAIGFDRLTSITVTATYNAIVLLLAILDSWNVRQHRADLTRSPLPKLSIGRDNPVALSIESGDRAAQLLVRDDYPLDFNVSPSQLRVTLPPRTQKTLTYTVNPPNRGEFRWGNIRVRQLGNWGLAWHEWTIDQAQTVAVYPDLIGVRSLSIRLTLQLTGNMRQSRRGGMGTEFAELREYARGDDPRLIDWKATARRLGNSSRMPLQVRELTPEREQTLMVLLDRGRLMTARVQGLKRFDWGLNTALSLAVAGLNRGDRVGVSVFDRDVVAWIPPERGQHQLTHLLERLTPIQPVLLEPDYMGAVTKLVKQQTRRSLVVVITDIVDATASAELLAALMHLTPRYLPFCIALRDPQVDAIAQTPTDDVSKAYERAVAIDLLDQRKLAFSQLKQKGVLVLDAPADRISEEAVDRYLQLKARNRI